MVLSSIDTRWFAIQVRPRFEKSVAEILAGKGYQQFLPLCRACVDGPCGQAERPLFPGYVFCRFDSRVHAPIVTTPGVIRIVAFGNIPASISDAEMAAIRTIMKTSLPVGPYTYFRSGQTIRIDEGPLRGVEGQIVKSGKKNLLVISIHLLQRSIAV